MEPRLLMCLWPDLDACFDCLHFDAVCGDGLVAVTPYLTGDRVESPESLKSLTRLWPMTRMWAQPGLNS